MPLKPGRPPTRGCSTWERSRRSCAPACPSIAKRPAAGSGWPNRRSPRKALKNSAGRWAAVRPHPAWRSRFPPTPLPALTDSLLRPWRSARRSTAARLRAALRFRLQHPEAVRRRRRLVEDGVLDADPELVEAGAESLADAEGG